ncbi:MAG: 30S ribosomal protein S8 [Alphaproteobacteria bacterium]|nr:30S ribosomal protein S8 [Alphaproteobacteria bacterium]
MLTDPIADLLARIRNAQAARKAVVSSPASRLRGRLLDVLQKEGYIRGYSRKDLGRGKAAFEIELKYVEGQPAIQEMARVSTPGRRVYAGVEALPRVYNGLGIAVVSTPKGVMSDADARSQRVGGEVLCTVY